MHHGRGQSLYQHGNTGSCYSVLPWILYRPSRKREELYYLTTYVPCTSLSPDPIPSQTTFRLNLTSSSHDLVCCLKFLKLFLRQTFDASLSSMQSIYQNLLRKYFFSFNKLQQSQFLGNFPSYLSHSSYLSLVECIWLYIPLPSTAPSLYSWCKYIYTHFTLPTFSALL